MKIITRIVFALTALALYSCSDSQNEYSTSACFFIFDNATHQDATLASAMNASSPGIFCYITKTIKSGATYFSFKSNQGTSSSSIANAIDQKRTVILGYNNGIIVGFGNLDNPAVFYAFDNQCPNCFDPEAIPVKNYPLTLSSNAIATCNTCHREYNMNSGGNISKGDAGKKLTRYRATTGGPLGVLSVN